MNTASLIIVGVLAQGPPRDTGPDFGKASPFGLLIVVLLLVGTFLLIWSMNRHLRKLPKSFEDPESQQPGDDSATDSDSASDGPDPGTLRG